ncbi:MAG: hypothetical protein U1A77_09970 [Pirellulales bacterium]
MAPSFSLAAKRSTHATLNAELARFSLGAVPNRESASRLRSLLADSLSAKANSLRVEFSPAQFDYAVVLGERLVYEGRLPRFTEVRAEGLLMRSSEAAKWRRCTNRQILWDLERKIDTRKWVMSTRVHRPLSMITAGLITGRTLDQISAASGRWLEPHALVSSVLIEQMSDIVGAWLETLHQFDLGQVFSPASEFRRLAIPKVVWSFLPERARQFVLEAHDAIADGRAVAPARWDVLYPAARQILHHALLLSYLELLSREIDSISSGDEESSE